MEEEQVEEQVVGTLRRCSICEDKTLHVDGVCQSHKVIRRKRRRPRAPLEHTTAPPKPKTGKRTTAPPKRKSAWRLWFSLVVAGGLIALLGALHIVHGGTRGWHLCWKDGWSLSQTIVDLDDKPSDAFEQCHL